MKNKKQVVLASLIILVAGFIQCSRTFEKTAEEIAASKAGESAKSEKNKSLIAEGKEIFRFDTFGDEDFLERVIAY